MKKVLTLFCALMVTFLTVGVAKAQTTFQVSEAPSDDAHWYVMTLDNFIISSADLDYANGGKFSMKSKSVIDAVKDASLWCIVGNETNGYRLMVNTKSLL